LSIRYGQKKTAGIWKQEREKSNGQNSKTQDGKVDAETRDAKTRDAQEPSSRPSSPPRIGQAPRRTQGAAQRVVAGKSHCRMLPAGGSRRVRPAEIVSARRQKNPGRTHIAIKAFRKAPENAAKMCACSNTLTAKLKNIARLLNVTVNKSTDIVQGFDVRTDSNSREK
jgi:hypothetical protein